MEAEEQLKDALEEIASQVQNEEGGTAPHKDMSTSRGMDNSAGQGDCSRERPKNKDFGGIETKHSG